MKKVLLTTVLLSAFGFTIKAQTEKGAWLIGATTNLSFTSTSFNNSDNNLNELDFTVSAGKFAVDNLVLGLNINHSSVSDGFDKEATHLVGPFMRYYAEGSFFVGVSFLMGSKRLKSLGTELTFNGNYIGLEAGYPIWLFTNVAIEPTLNYSIGGGDFDGSSAVGINIGFGLYF